MKKTSEKKVAAAGDEIALSGRTILGTSPDLTSVTIPKGVRKIGDSAFKGCRKPKSATIAAIVPIRFRMSLIEVVALTNGHIMDNPWTKMILSAWAGDKQIHLGEVIEAARDAGDVPKVEWKGFELCPRKIKRLVWRIVPEDWHTTNPTVDYLHWFGMEYLVKDFRGIASPPPSRREWRQYVDEFVDLRPRESVRFWMDCRRLWDDFHDAMRGRRKLSYEEAVELTASRFNVSRMVAERLVACHRNWSYSFIRGTSDMREYARWKREERENWRKSFFKETKIIHADSDSKNCCESDNGKRGKTTANKKPSTTKNSKVESYSYTITFSGDGVSVNRVEYKTQAELDDCLECARTWNPPGGDGVHGFIVDDDGVHLQVTDGNGNVVFETDIKKSNLTGKSSKLRIESKGSCFDESAKATKGKKFYYQSDDWYSGYQWEAELVLDAPFDAKKLSLVCQSYVNKNGRECKFIREECSQYGGDSIVKIAKSTDEEPTGGDDQVDAWTLVKGVRKGLDYSVEE